MTHFSQLNTDLVGKHVSAIQLIPAKCWREADAERIAAKHAIVARFISAGSRDALLMLHLTHHPLGSIC
jgi:hypothetical protein